MNYRPIKDGCIVAVIPIGRDHRRSRRSGGIVVRDGITPVDLSPVNNSVLEKATDCRMSTGRQTAKKNE